METDFVKETIGKERIEASDELLVSSPVAPNTPEAAAHRRTGQTYLLSDAESFFIGFFNFLFI